MGAYTLADKLAFAERMREQPTLAEAKLWARLSTGEFGCWQSQILILGYIVDFYCADRKLVVEVDGSSHDDRKTEDKIRDRALRKVSGIRTIRFTNEQVLNHIASVLRQITNENRAKHAKKVKVVLVSTPKKDWTADSRFRQQINNLAQSLSAKDRLVILKTLDATCQKYMRISLKSFMSKIRLTHDESIEFALIRELVRRFAIRPREVANLNVPAANNARRLEGNPRLNSL